MENLGLSLKITPTSETVLPPCSMDRVRDRDQIYCKLSPIVSYYLPMGFDALDKTQKNKQPSQG